MTDGGEVRRPEPLPRQLAEELARREELELALRETLRALRADNEELRDFVENAGIGMHRVGPDGTILWANRAELDMLGYAADEYVGRPIADFHVDKGLIADMLARLACGESVHEVEACLLAKDGTTRHVVLDSSVYAPDGVFMHTRCVTRDITRRRTAEAARDRSEALLRAVTDALPALVSYVDADERYRFVSAAYERWFGRPREEVLGKHLSDVLGAEGYEKTRPYIERALRGEQVSYEDDVTYVDGRTRSIAATYIPQRSPDGASGFVVLVNDVTERTRLTRFRAAAASRAERLGKVTAAIANAVSSEQVYEALVDRVHATLGATSVALWLVDEDGRFATLARQKGYAEAVVGRFAQLPLDGSAAIPAADCIVRGQPVWIGSQSELLEHYPHLVQSVSAGAAYRVSCLPLVVRGRILGALALTTAVTAEPAAEEQEFLLLTARYASQAAERLRLFELERRSRAEADDAARRAGQLYHFAEAVAVADNVNVVFDAALAAIQGALGTERVAILRFDAHKVMRFVAWRGLSDAYRAAVEGHSPWSPDATAPEPVLVPDALGDAALRGYAELFAAEKIGALGFFPIVNRERLLGKFMVYYAEPHAFANDEVELALALARHLASVMARFSAIASLEETLRANELFAGVLAHDLQNPLSAMVMAAEVMLMRHEGEATPDPSAKPLGKILSSGKRMARMIEQLLDFTRARTGGGIQIHPRSAFLDELCGQASDELELAHPEWNIERHVAGDLGGRWDPDRMLQVVSNLIANAGQHGAPGGRVNVRIDGSLADQVTFEVHNAGAIPAPLLPHLFDPFRRHDGARGGGLGLGLFIVHQIVVAHGGSVRVSSSEEAGTTFRVLLPRVAEVPADTAKARPN